jgi:hypothetical protein
MRVVVPRFLAVLLFGVLLVAGCVREVTVQPLSKEVAIAAARGFAAVPPSAVVVKAEAGPFGRFEPNPNGKMSPPPADHWVWHVQFRDSGGIISGAIIDYISGALVETYIGIPN